MIAATIPRRKSHERCAPGVIPKILPMSPIKASFGNSSVRRSTFWPAGASENFSGKFRAHASKLIAIPFTPSYAEYIYLKGRRVLADQMEYLLAHFPRSSPLHKRLSARPQ
mgnify:CR=1 FL=1